MEPSELMPIVNQLKEHNIAYALGGSGLLYGLNRIDSVNDWDLAVDCPKEALIQAIRDYDWIEQSSGDFPFASEYRISIASPNIDFIGGFALRSGEATVRMPIRIRRQWNGINVSSPEVWYVAYSLMGRTSKASLLLDYLKRHPSAVDADAVNYFLNVEGLPEDIQEELRSLVG